MRVIACYRPLDLQFATAYGIPASVHITGQRKCILILIKHFISLGDFVTVFNLTLKSLVVMSLYSYAVVNVFSLTVPSKHAYTHAAALTLTRLTKRT